MIDAPSIPFWLVEAESLTFKLRYGISVGVSTDNNQPYIDMMTNIKLDYDQRYDYWASIW